MEHSSIQLSWKYTESIDTVSSASQQQLPKQDTMITFHVTPLWQYLDTATKYQSVTWASQLLQERKCDELFVLNYQYKHIAEMKPKLKQWGKLSGIKINSSRKISKNVYQVIFFHIVSVQSILPYACNPSYTDYRYANYNGQGWALIACNWLPKQGHFYLQSSL